MLVYNFSIKATIKLVNTQTAIFYLRGFNSPEVEE
jgi:hypothetical protein